MSASSQSPRIVKDPEKTAGPSATGPDAMWFLVAQAEPSPAAGEIPIATPFTIGREANASLCIQSSAVSRLHAEIRVDDGKLRLVDLGSTNGSFLNGSRIETSAVLRENDLIQFGEAVFRVGRRNLTSGVATRFSDVSDRALATVQFNKLLNTGTVVAYFQPIVDLRNGHTAAYEVLGRSHVYGLREPAALFAVASQLNKEKELSRLFRTVGICKSGCLPDSAALFLNTHPRELEDIQGLIDSLRQARPAAGAHKLVLEIHEDSATSPSMMDNLATDLRGLNVEFAFDNFGGGNSRLLETLEAAPDYLKFDMRLIRGIHDAGREKQRAVADLVKLARDLQVRSIAQGVETKEECLACQAMGFDYGQGFFLGRPASSSQILRKAVAAKS